MSIGVNKRNTIAYFKHETSGVATPASATDSYVAISSDFSATKEREILTSDLISGSIGQRKGQLGMLSASAEIGFEFKGKGSAGAPEYSQLLETLLGAKSSIASQKTVDSGSTVSILKLTSTTGLEQGMAIICKHATHPHECRVISEVTNSTDIVVVPDLAFAPAASTEIMAVGNTLYKPANTGHKPATLGLYYGNEVYQKTSKCLVESLSIEVQTGQIAKAKASVKGLDVLQGIGASPYTPVYDISEGLVGLSVDAYLIDSLGVSKQIDFPSCTININNELAELLSAKEQSGKVSQKVKSRTIEISMPQYLDNTNLDNQDWYDTLEDFSFVLLIGQKASDGSFQNGKTITFYTPRNNFTKAPFADENDIVTEDLTFNAHIGANLPEVFIAYP